MGDPKLVSTAADPRHSFVYQRSTVGNLSSRGTVVVWFCGESNRSSNSGTRPLNRRGCLVGVGALLTKKKLKCQTCGEFNDTGTAKPYDGPESRKWRKRWEKIEIAKSGAQRETERRQAQGQADALASALFAAAADFRSQQDPPPVRDESTIRTIEAQATPAPPPPPPAWMTDPTGRHEVRYWDGGQWTQHVSDNGVQATDPTA